MSDTPKLSPRPGTPLTSSLSGTISVVGGGSKRQRAKSIAPQEGCLTLELLDGEKAELLHTYCDVHRIEWKETLNVPIGGGRQVQMPPGKCNLMFYPAIQWLEDQLQRSGLHRQASSRKSAVERANATSGEIVEALGALLMLAMDDASFSEAADPVGTLPILALAIANTEASVRLVKKLVDKDPHRALSTHAAGPVCRSGAQTQG